MDTLETWKCEVFQLRERFVVRNKKPIVVERWILHMRLGCLNAAMTLALCSSDMRPLPARMERGRAVQESNGVLGEFLGMTRCAPKWRRDLNLRSCYRWHTWVSMCHLQATPRGRFFFFKSISVRLRVQNPM